VALLPVETAQEHVRRALQLLEELEDQLRGTYVSIPARYDQVGLLAAARRRLWLAVAALESRSYAIPPRLRRERLGQSRGWLLMIGLAAVVWPARALAFALRGVWRSARPAMRLLRTVHRIWP
jgi:hypothetical protein